MFRTYCVGIQLTNKKLLSGLLSYEPINVLDKYPDQTLPRGFKISKESRATSSSTPLYNCFMYLYAEHFDLSVINIVRSGFGRAQ
jgi:hypothetical protein